MAVEESLTPDFDEYLKSEITKVLASQNVGSDDTRHEAAVPSTIGVTIGGQKFTFNNEAELSAAVEQTLSRAQQEIVQARVAATAPPVAAGAKGDDAPDWSMDTFINLMGTDPRKAFDYVDNHRYFDGKVENASKAIKEQLAEAENIKRVLAVEQFRQLHPEFPTQSEPAARLVNQVREEMNLPYSAQGLEAAYYMAINKNADFRAGIQSNLAQLQTQKTNPEPQARQTSGGGMFNQQFSNPYLAPPPTIGRSAQSAAPQFSDQDLESLPLESLEKLLNKANR